METNNNTQKQYDTALRQAREAIRDYKEAFFGSETFAQSEALAAMYPALRRLVEAIDAHANNSGYLHGPPELFGAGERES